MPVSREQYRKGMKAAAKKARKKGQILGFEESQEELARIALIIPAKATSGLITLAFRATLWVATTAATAAIAFLFGASHVIATILRIWVPIIAKASWPIIKKVGAAYWKWIRVAWLLIRLRLSGTRIEFH